MVVCSINSNKTKVEHYFNNKNTPKHIDPKSLSIGLSKLNVSIYKRNLTCSFTRNNLNNNKLYYSININKNYYMLVAYGKGKIIFFK